MKTIFWVLAFLVVNAVSLIRGKKSSELVESKSKIKSQNTKG